MPPTRHISGEIVFPADTAPGIALRVLVEVHDVSMQDQASTTLAKTVLRNVSIGPSARVPFALTAPCANANRSLSMRVQVNLHLDQSDVVGDYLSTEATPVAATGDAMDLVTRVKKI